MCCWVVEANWTRQLPELTRKSMSQKLKLQPLELLDLGKCQTVSEIVDGMSRCAFGARMLGEVAATLATWCSDALKPVLIYDGIALSPLGKMLNNHLVKEA